MLKLQYFGHQMPRAGSLEKEAREDEVVRWHHRLNRQEFEQTLVDGEGQGSLACCHPWGHRGLNMT